MARLTRATALAVLETTAKAMDAGIEKARALTEVMQEYRNDRNEVKVNELAALVRAAIPTPSGDEELRLTSDSLYQQASLSDADTADGQEAWQAYLDAFDTGRSTTDKFRAYRNAARHLPVE